MKEQNDLILDRFRKEAVLKKTQHKEIWLMVNVCTNQYYIANLKSSAKNVLHEASYMIHMQGHGGIPLMHWSGPGDSQILFICQYLGWTLEQRLQQCGGKFSLKSTCMIGINLIKNLRILHEKGLIHRCLKSNALQLGRGFKSMEIYFNDLIDCKRFRNKKSFVHIPYKKGIKYTYENCFGSSRFHNGEQISRIDDIESVIMILVYFYTGIKPNQKGQFNLQAIPNFLKELFQGCDNCGFYDQPFYQWFIQKLNSVLFHASYLNDCVYDWMLIPRRLDMMKVKKHVASLKVDQDKDILAELYEPYEQLIDIDEIGTKHYNNYGGNISHISNNYEQKKLNQPPQCKLKTKRSVKKDRSQCNLM